MSANQVLKSIMAGLVFFLLGGMLPAPAQTPQVPAAERVTANFTVLVGFPGGPEGASGAALLVPGTVIPLDVPAQSSGTMQKTLREKSLAFTQTVEKLWGTFRLDPERRLQKSAFRSTEVGKPVELPAIEGANLRISPTMVSFNATTVTYRVVFRQGDTVIADSSVPVARGGSAVVGAMDGDTAPYVFLLIAPELPEPVSKSIPAVKRPGITEPVPIQKVNPVYPEEAMKQKIMGTVLLDIILDTEGKVLDVRIIDDPHPLLSNAAVEAVKQWTFTPAKNENGKPVSVRSTITFVFKLQ